MPNAKLHKQNLIGSLWMVAAMGAFALEDAFMKAVLELIPMGEVLILFGLGGALIYASIMLWQREPLFIPDVLSRPMLLRMGFETTGRLFYMLAIALIPLSVVTVILQATPLVVVAGAVFVFGERAGWRRWVAILVGLLGVIVIVKPGADSFSALSLLAILGMLGFAGRDLASRVAPPTVGTYMLGLYGFLSIIVAGVIYCLWAGTWLVMPGAQASLCLVVGILFGVFAYACLMKAMKTGEVSAVTPFRYVRLLFGIATGVLIFGETITLDMLIGSVLILVSGLFIMWRRNTGVAAVLYNSRIKNPSANSATNKYSRYLIENLKVPQAAVLSFVYFSR